MAGAGQADQGAGRPRAAANCMATRAEPGGPGDTGSITMVGAGCTFSAERVLRSCDRSTSARQVSV